ncbi:MAG: HAD family hydrolase [Candidatus Omnitrophica bacterium]|nr:HAD family hydrolase [Candidatus Omnitrophota bacterium]
MKIKGIIFDFDGVILETVGVKNQSFYELFRHIPEHVDEIVDYHMANGGLSRFKKFDYIYREILKEPLSPEKSKELGARFGQLCHDGVVNAEFVPGAKEFLEYYYTKSLLFIASATPHEELMGIVKKRNLEKYFTGIYGSPQSKASIAGSILKKHGLNPDEMFFVGDAINDYVGAKEVGVPFIGRVHTMFDNPFKDIKDGIYINDLYELDHLVRENNYV